MLCLGNTESTKSASILRNRGRNVEIITSDQWKHVKHPPTDLILWNSRFLDLRRVNFTKSGSFWGVSIDFIDPRAKKHKNIEYF